MSQQSPFKQFEAHLKTALESGVFNKISLGNYQGEEPGLKQVFARIIVIKGEDMLTFTYRYKTRDVVKNEVIENGISKLVDYLGEDFRIGTLFTTTAEVQLETLKNGKTVLRTKQVNAAPLATEHDKLKNRQLGTEGKTYLNALGITDYNGQVLKTAQDKFKQINHYIEILAPLIRQLPAGKRYQIADMGAGKGYLTFALYDFLTHELKLDVEVTGVEFRPDLVELCNRIAQASGFRQLKFVEGTIESYETGTVDVLIALHACDTATDDAIFKGITANAKLIVVAPCCHKQIRKEMEKNKADNGVTFLTRHGIFMERQAEMVTDGMRALLLEYAGYKTRVFEFISDAHTPKNVLIVGERKGESRKLKAESEEQKVLEKIRSTRAYFGIGYHHLERLMGL